jgi:hypothetical protein
MHRHFQNEVGIQTRAAFVRVSLMEAHKNDTVGPYLILTAFFFWYFKREK